MGIGSMRDRIDFLQPHDTPLPGGGGSTTYSTYVTVWTKVIPVKSQRELENSQIELVDSLKFTVRFDELKQPNKRMLLQFEDRIYTINSIKEQGERRRYWEIIAYSDDGSTQFTT